MESDSGVTSVQGLAKISPAGIVLEFEKSLFGIIKDGIKEIRIPVSEILDLRLKSGFFNTRLERYLFNSLELRTTSLARLEGLPFKDGKAKFKIKRFDISSAEEAIEMIEAAQQSAPQLPADIPGQTPLQRMINHEDSDTLELVEHSNHSTK